MKAKNLSEEVEVKKPKEEPKQEKNKRKHPVKKKNKKQNPKMKLLIAKKANELTKKVEQAVTIEQQMLVQRQSALISSRDLIITIKKIKML